MGRIASVNLTSGKIEIETPNDQLHLKYLGGYGLGACFLYTRTKPGIDPLEPDNLLGFIAGPLSGTPAICGNRSQVVGKSPRTGRFGDANSGGDFGPKTKFAGFHGLLFSGISEKPGGLPQGCDKHELDRRRHRRDRRPHRQFPRRIQHPRRHQEHDPEGLRPNHRRPAAAAGPTNGITVDLATQEREYLEEMGWGPDGAPRRQSLERLGLDFVVPDIHG